MTRRQLFNTLVAPLLGAGTACLIAALVGARGDNISQILFGVSATAYIIGSVIWIILFYLKDSPIPKNPNPTENHTASNDGNISVSIGNNNKIDHIGHKYGVEPPKFTLENQKILSSSLSKFAHQMDFECKSEFELPRMTAWGDDRIRRIDFCLRPDFNYEINNMHMVWLFRKDGLKKGFSFKPEWKFTLLAHSNSEETPDLEFRKEEKFSNSEATLIGIQVHERVE